METVRFVSAKPYLKLPDEEFDKLLFCTNGPKEYVILCSDKLLQELKDVPSDYFTPTYKEIVNYLVMGGIPFEIENKSTTTI